MKKYKYVVQVGKKKYRTNDKNRAWKIFDSADEKKWNALLYDFKECRYSHTVNGSVNLNMRMKCR
jgi:hypothetical protein